MKNFYIKNIVDEYSKTKDVNKKIELINLFFELVKNLINDNLDSELDEKELDNLTYNTLSKCIDDFIDSKQEFLYDYIINYYQNKKFVIKKNNTIINYKSLLDEYKQTRSPLIKEKIINNYLESVEKWISYYSCEEYSSDEINSLAYSLLSIFVDGSASSNSKYFLHNLKSYIIGRINLNKEKTIKIQNIVNYYLETKNIYVKNYIINAYLEKAKDFILEYSKEAFSNEELYNKAHEELSKCIDSYENNNDISFASYLTKYFKIAFNVEPRKIIRSKKIADEYYSTKDPEKRKQLIDLYYDFGLNLLSSYLDTKFDRKTLEELNNLLLARCIDKYPISSSLNFSAYINNYYRMKIGIINKKDNNDIESIKSSLLYKEKNVDDIINMYFDKAIYYVKQYSYIECDIETMDIFTRQLLLSCIEDYKKINNSRNQDFNEYMINYFIDFFGYNYMNSNEVSIYDEDIYSNMNVEDIVENRIIIDLAKKYLQKYPYRRISKGYERRDAFIRKIILTRNNIYTYENNTYRDTAKMCGISYSRAEQIASRFYHSLMNHLKLKGFDINDLIASVDTDSLSSSHEIVRKRH